MPFGSPIIRAIFKEQFAAVFLDNSFSASRSAGDRFWIYFTNSRLSSGCRIFSLAGFCVFAHSMGAICCCVVMSRLFAGKAAPYPVVTECGVSVPGSAVGVPRCRSVCLFFAVESARSWEVERGKNGAESGLAAPRRRASASKIRITMCDTYVCKYCW